MVTLINEKVTKLSFSSTLLTVVGTVLGFVISYRTTSSFERYNEGRRLWSQIILASRTLARAVWFHVPELPPATADDEAHRRSEEERRARNLVEKKTVINLIEAFSVAVKHYLRGEEGIAYEDLYHLVKFLPSYAFPTGVIPSEQEAAENLRRTQSYREAKIEEEEEEEKEKEEEARNAHTTGTTLRPSIASERPPSSNNKNSNTHHRTRSDGAAHVSVNLLPLPVTANGNAPRSRARARSSASATRNNVTFRTTDDSDVLLLPSSLPPRHSVFDVFPFSLFIKCLEGRGKAVEGKKAARLRAKNVLVTRNVPLEVLMYMTSYVSTLTARKAIDVPTTNLLIATVNQLTDALTGLERILTTPIPFSYSMHLWLVAIIYVLALPFQIYTTLGWITIPATGIISFIFFGFLVAGEEIENPFGYDKNDLNMDHFTHNIIRNELRALTAFPPPGPESWAFSPRNDRLFVTVSPMVDEKSSIKNRDTQNGDVATSPDEWVRRGTSAMKDALAHGV